MTTRDDIFQLRDIMVRLGEAVERWEPDPRIDPASSAKLLGSVTEALAQTITILVDHLAASIGVHWVPEEADRE